ncbi:hypothetical protein [Pseudonocardia asaccharolytica]|uniref:hypothetical protein n=1 Tax=Pseudonocardia asaccharolytica TaxID=54010 RepID=UPI001377A4F4|nr:hypothetical protein [Pseudonocardia asaccharolytica]
MSGREGPVEDAATRDQPVEIVVSDEPGAGPALRVDGRAVAVPAGQDPEAVGLAAVAVAARRHGHPIPAVLIADRGSLRWRLLVHPDGATIDDDTPTLAPAGPRPRPRGRLVVAGIALLVLAGGVALAVRPTPAAAPETGVASGPASLAPVSPPGSPEILGPPPAPPPTPPGGAVIPPSSAPPTSHPGRRTRRGRRPAAAPAPQRPRRRHRPRSRRRERPRRRPPWPRSGRTVVLRDGRRPVPDRR